MSSILIFSGTTEGRILSEILSEAGISCDVSVATEYGVTMMEESEKVRILSGRLDVPAMKQLYNENQYSAVVDATHPYATEVTRNIKESLSAYNIPYLRLLRDGGNSADSSFSYYTSVADCVKALKQTEGNILVTTGSKELSTYCRTKSMTQRVFARVLPSTESIETCKRNGLSGRQIIAMQGPFSEETNIATIRQFDIAHIVTKESGKMGGEDEKLSAAKKTGIQCHIIERPRENNEEGVFTTSQILGELSKILGKNIKGVNVAVSLVGIGCGNKKQMTEEAREAIANADYLFGAERMIESINSDAVKFPYYRKDEIIPELEKINSENIYNKKVAILFSGDSGFYSGASTLSDALSELSFVKVSIIPGISSVSCLASRIGVSYSEANIISTHGVRKEKWLPEILYSAKYNKRTFFITSGPDDINSIGAALLSMDMQPGDISIILGYQLTYPDEEVKKLTPRDCLNVGKSGLYVGLIINPAPGREVITPSLSDSDFIRGDVPMTKEEVRQVTLCKLSLTKNAVLYDIGSGTGSIAVSAAKLSPGIDVYAVECRNEACKLIEKNAIDKGCVNVTVINDRAPEALKKLPMATHAFIGGTGGSLRDILKELFSINPFMHIVMNAVSLESIGEIMGVLKDFNVINIDTVMVQASKIRELGSYHMPQAMNPVYIFTFDFTEKLPESIPETETKE